MTRILVTRAAPDGETFADHCRAFGLEPILAPVMAIEIEKVPPDLSGIGALAFTSANGVRAFAANSDDRRLPVFAVGAATAEAAKASGFADIHTAGGDVSSLANRIATENAIAGKTLLHVAGADRAGDLVALLKDRGISARRQTMYRARPFEALEGQAIAALKDENTPLWVSFFSPRTARLFLDLAETAGLKDRLINCRAACLSEAVAAEAGAARWASVEIAAERTGESLLRLVQSRA